MKAIKLLYEYKNMRVLQGSDNKDIILKELDNAISELEELQRSTASSKLGKWIRNTYTNRVFKYSYQDLQYDLANPLHAENDILWTVRAGEWAWWLDEEGRTVLHKGYKNWGDEIVADIGNSTCKRYHCLEPFIGRLPELLEDIR